MLEYMLIIVSMFSFKYKYTEIKMKQTKYWTEKSKVYKGNIYRHLNYVSTNIQLYINILLIKMKGKSLPATYSYFDHNIA